MSVQTPMANGPRNLEASPVNNPERLKQNQDLKTRAVDTVNKAVEDRGVSTVASPENPGVDATQMSAEVIDEIANTAKANPMSDIDSLIQGLQSLVAPRVDQHLQQGKNGANEVDPVGGANKAQEPQDQKQKKAYWAPTTENGMIHQGQDTIGRVDVREETVKAPEKGGEGQAAQNATKKPQAPRQVAAAGGAGGSKAAGGGTGGATGTGATGAAGAAGAAGAPRATQGPAQVNGNKPARDAQPSEATGDDQESDKVELSDETKQAAQSMQNQGVQQPQPLQQAAQGKKTGDSGEGSYDVITRATGATQTVQTAPAGDLSTVSSFRTFQKLDDSPLLAHATLHRRKGGDVAGEVEQNQQAQAAGQPRQVGSPSEAADPQLMQKLRSPVAT